MKVILLQDIRGVGKKGDEREVSSGYALNFLIPRKLAKPLTKQLQAELASVKAMKSKKVSKLKKALTAVRNQIQGKKFTINVKANEQGTLFKAVSADDIKGCILSTGTNLPESTKIVLSSPIKTKGEYKVEIVFPGFEKATIELTII